MPSEKRIRCPRCTVMRAPSMFTKERDGVKLQTRWCRICLDQDDRRQHREWKQRAKILNGGQR
jgi:hypothetical protein